MEPEDSLPHSQEPATCPCSEPAQSSPCYHPSHFFNSILTSHLCLGLQSCLFPSGFPNKTLCTPLPLRATCPVHLILLYLITRIIFSWEYRSLSSFSCNFLHSPVTSSILHPYTPLSTLFSKSLNLCSSFCVTISFSKRTFG